MGKLNSLSVQRIQEAGLYGDGNGLYLQVLPSSTKSWVFRFMLNKKSRSMGLGPTDLVSLAEARMKAIGCRKMLLDGIDPIEARRAEKQARALLDAKAMTFAQCASAYIDSHRAGWKNAKHEDQWTNTIETYANPIIGHLSIQDVDTGLIMKILEPIWRIKTETASRLRGRLELVLSWATVHQYRKGENPARWRGHLDNLLPKRSSVQQVQHFTALPINEMGSFMKRLRELEGVVPLGLEFQILTACRTNEVMGAKWSEVNFEESLWVIPASRMKARREHRVPLSKRALEILRSIKEYSESEFVFPGRHNSQLSSNAFLALLKKRLEVNVTAHGFRSTFRDWASEKTGHTREVIEMALAHSIKDATEAAYRRGDLLMKRQILMSDWAKFCATISLVSGRVTEILNRVK
ncbi:MAG: tyrosine-type recombinase/integrase [Bdellovibrionales bacterium]